jgi:hypothetical protein
MGNPNQQARYSQLEIWIEPPRRSSHDCNSTGSSLTPAPMERWESERGAAQPFNAIAAFKVNPNWRECSSAQGTSSTKAQNGSFDEKSQDERYKKRGVVFIGALVARTHFQEKIEYRNIPHQPSSHYKESLSNTVTNKVERTS